MNSISLPNETDFRRWMQESLHDFFANPVLSAQFSPTPEPEKLLTRKEIAGIFRISLVTLHDWMNRGLPCHKQRGRVYFIRSEVMDYVKAHDRRTTRKAQE